MWSRPGGGRLGGVGGWATRTGGTANRGFSVSSRDPPTPKRRGALSVLSSERCCGVGSGEQRKEPLRSRAHRDPHFPACCVTSGKLPPFSGLQFPPL